MTIGFSSDALKTTANDIGVFESLEQSIFYILITLNQIIYMYMQIRHNTHVIDEIIYTWKYSG
jgi:hypothetical protein